VPGIILLIIGAFTAVGGPATMGWLSFSAVAVGIGTSLVLDEFALILHLQDVYWSGEGQLSVEAVSLVAACLGLALVCILKGKYRSGLFGLFLPPAGLIGAVRLARPNSIWARRRSRGHRLEHATPPAADVDRRWTPLQVDWENFIGGRPSQPNPPAPPGQDQNPSTERMGVPAPYPPLLATQPSAPAAHTNMVTPIGTAVPCPASPMAEAAMAPTRNCSSPCSEDAAPAAER
jgi:hypothetical protein